MSKQLMTINRETCVTGATPEAEAQKKQVLEKTKKITQVTSADELKLAIEAASVAKGFSSSIEAVRADIKRPVIDLGKAIEAVANGLRNEVDAEYKRLTDLVSGYHRAEREKAQKALAAAQEEQRRQQAEIERLQAEARAAEAKAANLKTKAAQEKARAEASAKAAQAAAAELEMSESSPITTPASTGSTRGATVKLEYDYEVVDIHALYKHNPALVNLEPNRSEIKIHIAYGKEIPGLRVFQKDKTSVRGVNPNLALK